MEQDKNKIDEGLADLNLEADSVTKKLEKKLNKDQLDFIMKIAHKIQSGMEVEESCILAGVDFKKFQIAMDKDKDIARLVKLKRLSYKWTLLRALNKKAIEKGDDKMALLLLESAFPDEFGKNKKKGGGDGEDPIKDAIDYISKNGDSSALIDPKNGRGGKMREKSSNPLKSILDILK